MVTGGCLSVLVESVSSADGAGRPRRRRRKGGLHGGGSSGAPRDGFKGPAGPAGTVSEGPGVAVGVVGIEAVPSSNGTGMQPSLSYATYDGVTFCEFCHTTLHRRHPCVVLCPVSYCLKVLLLLQTCAKTFCIEFAHLCLYHLVSTLFTTNSDFAGVSHSSVNNETASSAAPSGDAPNPKPPREQKSRGQRPPTSKRGGGNAGGGPGGDARIDGKQKETLVNGTSA